MTDVSPAILSLGLELRRYHNKLYSQGYRFARTVLRRFDMHDAYLWTMSLNPGSRLVKATRGDRLVNPDESQA
jgi:hypothetical protein